MKLNLGCGFDKKQGYINLDSFEKCNPDILHNIESRPFPFKDNTFDEILIKHVLEHVGQTFDMFKNIMQEIYRISIPGARIEIQVPNYKHSSFWSDPTHVRTFDELTFKMMSKKKNDEWILKKENITMLAYLMDVDFELVNTIYVPDPYHILNARKNNTKDIKNILLELNRKEWNAIKELWFELKVIKSP